MLERGMDRLRRHRLLVVRLEILRLLFALAVKKNWEICQINARTTCLDGDLDEEIYVEPPKGCDVPEGYILQLTKAFCGPEQAGH